MKRFAYKVQLAINRNALWFVALIGITASVSIFLFVRHLERSQAEAEFRQVANQRLEVVRTNVIGVLDTVNLLAATFQTETTVTNDRKTFSSLAASVLSKHPYFQAIEWIPRVDAADRAKLESLAHKEGNANYRILELGPAGAMVPAPSQEQYFPVLYAEPLKGNERAIGYNLASNPARKEALLAATDTGRAVASTRLRLIQEKGDQYGVLVFAPVYDKSDPGEVQARRAALKGFILAVIRAGDFISSADSSTRVIDSSHVFDVCLFDLSAPLNERQLYPSAPVSRDALGLGLHAEVSFDMAGHEWLLVATPGPEYRRAPLFVGSLVVLGAGLFITAVYLLYLQNRLKRAEQIAKSEREILRLNRALSTLSKCKEALVYATDEADLLEKICGIVVLYGGYRAAWVGFAKDSPEKTVCIKARAGAYGDYIDNLLVKWDESDDGQRPGGIAVRTGEVSIIHNIRNAAEFRPWMKSALEQGYSSIIGLPLRDEVDLHGVLTIYAAEPDAFNSQEVELLKELAMHFSYGIRSFRNTAQRQTAEAAAREMEERLRQSQKLESLGRLTGGVAHDFNNLLTIVACCTEVLQRQFAPSDPARENTARIFKTVERGADLVRQLLAFSRKQVLSPQLMDLNALIFETYQMIQVLLGKKIRLEFIHDDSLWAVMADPSQMTQVLMNLCVNARDAMPTGGSLTIQTENKSTDGLGNAVHPGVPAGDYVMVSISDTGAGMTEEILEHIFEPFFTTKDRGKGTGLGLATVHGIILQSGGYIRVESEEGNGATFRFYLPKVEGPVKLPVKETLAPSEAVVLLAEDEEVLRSAISTYLREQGYVVIEACDGREALELANKETRPIRLLITDLLMPNLNGCELASCLADRAGMKIILMTGCGDVSALRQFKCLEGAPLLHKPFSLRSLGELLETLLKTKA